MTTLKFCGFGSGLEILALTWFLPIFLHKCTFRAQFFSTWKRVNCGKISQIFPQFLKISQNFSKMSPHDNFFSTNIICDICYKYELCGDHHSWSWSWFCKYWIAPIISDRDHGFENIELLRSFLIVRLVACQKSFLGPGFCKCTYQMTFIEMMMMIIYILWWSVCLSVTKNEHFLLGVSCNHMNHS